MGNSLDELGKTTPMAVSQLNLNLSSVHIRSLAITDLNGINVGRINIAIEKPNSLEYAQKRMLSLADKVNL
jgi:hypothetical protein